jgi:hypothetical protein
VGVVSLFFGICCQPLALVGGIGAIVLGFMARHRIADSGGAVAGAGMAIAGMVTGGLAVLGSIAVMALFLTGGIQQFGSFTR